MTKKDFFRILIKLFVTYSLLLSLFTLIPTSIGYMIYNIGMVEILLIVGGFLLIIALYYFAIMNTDWFIKVLSLDKGYDNEQFTLGSITSHGIYKLAIIVIGGFMIIDYIPEFFYDCFLYFKNEVSANGHSIRDEINPNGGLNYFYWLIASLNILMGYLLIANSNRLAYWADNKK